LIRLVHLAQDVAARAGSGLHIAMARPPIKPLTKPPEVVVYSRATPAAAPVVPAFAPPETLPATPVAKASTELSSADCFGPHRPAPSRFPRDPEDVAAVPPTIDGKPVPPPARAVRLGPYLPRPHLFPRPLVERAMPAFGEPVDLPELVNVPDEEVPAAIARALDETEPAPQELIRRIGQARGMDFLRGRYARTRKIEAEGGLRLATHGRRRTPGGCFLVQCRDRMTLEAFETLSSLASLAVGLVPRSSEPPPT
jgi:hypothetical protein